VVKHIEEEVGYQKELSEKPGKKKKKTIATMVFSLLQNRSYCFLRDDNVHTQKTTIMWKSHAIDRYT